MTDIVLAIPAWSMDALLQMSVCVLLAALAQIGVVWLFGGIARWGRNRTTDPEDDDYQPPEPPPPPPSLTDSEFSRLYVR